MPVRIEPPLLCGKTFEFEGIALGQVVRRCNELGLQVFGVSSFAHKLELEGIVPAEWRSVHYQPRKAWICHDAKTIWSQIAYAAGKAKSGKLWDCAARISYQVETSIRRLQLLSDGYSTQLSTLLARRQFPDGSRIDDLWTQSVFLSIQSFLTDACVLRDYLAEFAAAFVYRLGESPRITSHAGLLKHLKRASSDDVLTKKLLEASAANGWLNELGSYRDLVVHSAPLALAQGRLWVWCKAIELAEGKRLPIVRFPLPAQPAAIMAARSKADYENFQMLIEQFAGSADVDPSMRDALRYAHTVMGDLAELALDLASHSPVAPQMPVLTDEDLAGPIQWRS
jgi:hypothetical protein